MSKGQVGTFKKKGSGSLPEWPHASMISLLVGCWTSVFRRRTSSTIFKYDFWLPLEKYGEFGRNEKT